MAYSKNTDTARACKRKLVKAFMEAKEQLAQLDRMYAAPGQDTIEQHLTRLEHIVAVLIESIQVKQSRLRQPKQIVAPKEPPMPLEDKVIAKMTILASRGQTMISPAVLSYSYMKNHKKSELRTVMDQRVDRGLLTKTCSAHAPYGKYSLV